MFLSAQIYFSVHKYIFQCTNVFFSAQICFSAQMYFSVHKNVSVHKYIFQCTNMFFSAQMYFSVHKYVSVHKCIFQYTKMFQCTNIFFSAQIYFSVHKYVFQCTNMFQCTNKFPMIPVHKIIPGTQWAKNGRRPWDYTVIEAWSRCLPRFRSVSSQIEAIFDRSSMFCRNCGKSFESSFAFCPNCGAKVEAETSLSSRDNIVGSCWQCLSHEPDEPQASFTFGAGSSCSKTVPYVQTVS